MLVPSISLFFCDGFNSTVTEALGEGWETNKVHVHFPSVNKLIGQPQKSSLYKLNASVNKLRLEYIIVTHHVKRDLIEIAKSIDSGQPAQSKAERWHLHAMLLCILLTSVVL